MSTEKKTTEDDQILELPYVQCLQFDVLFSELAPAEMADDLKREVRMSIEGIINRYKTETVRLTLTHLLTTETLEII